MTSTLLSLLSVVTLTVAAVRVGRRCLYLAAREAPAAGWVAPFLTGWVVFHLVLTAIQLVGVSWSAPVLLLAFGGLWAATEGLPGPTRPGAPRLRRPDAADALVAGVSTVFAAVALTLRSVHPDFVYHWAVKGQKFALAGGVDFPYLAHPWNHFGHPDYPTLLPEVYAVTIRLAGGVSEVGLMGWSVVVFAALMTVGRELLAERADLAGLLALGVFATGLGAFSIGFLQPGGADLALTLAFLAAWRPLTATTRTRHHDADLAGVAAFAAAVKLEGVILAGILVGLYALARLSEPAAASRRERIGAALRGTLRTAWLPLAVIALWATAAYRHDLFLPTNTGALRLDRFGAVAEAMLERAAVDAWHGLPWVLVLLPLLMVARPTRWPATAATLQLGFYLAVYLTTPVEPMLYVKTSFGRLLLAPVTVALTGTLWWLVRWVRTR